MRPCLAALCSVIAVTAVLATPGVASASQLIGRNASSVQLRVNARGEAMLSYTTAGKRMNVLAWGATNAVAPAMGTAQVQFRLDYAGGWGKYKRNLAKSFANTCRPYTGRSSRGSSRAAPRRTGAIGRCRAGSAGSRISDSTPGSRCRAPGRST